MHCIVIIIVEIFSFYSFFSRGGGGGGPRVIFNSCKIACILLFFSVRDFFIDFFKHNNYFFWVTILSVILWLDLMEATNNCFMN